MKDIQLRKVINKINNDINNNNEDDDLLLKEKDDYEDLFIEGKANTFKIYIAKIYIFLDIYARASKALWHQRQLVD